nr:PAS domain-containing protein [Polymorphobacter multimanifer]
MHEALPAAVSAQGMVDHAKLAMIAVDRTFMPMVVTDPNQHDNPIVLANRAFLDMSGYAAEEVIGRNCRFMQGSDTMPADVDVVRSAIDRRVGVTHEVLNYRKDGSPFWNQIHVSPIFDDNGKLIYFFGSHIDMTAARRVRDLERTEHAMLGEIDHRAMNVLALVQGIVRMTRADNVERYMHTVQGRIAALANAHRLLARGKWQAVPIDQVVRCELPAGIDRVDLSGPAVVLDASQVQPLALVFHEIIANAVEHGALSTPSGLLSVHWHAERETLVIEFAERGGPAPKPGLSRGYGLLIADAVVTKQLRGMLERDWKPAGLHSQLTIPCVSPQAPSRARTAADP